MKRKIIWLLFVFVELSFCEKKEEESCENGSCQSDATNHEKLKYTKKGIYEKNILCNYLIWFSRSILCKPYQAQALS